MESIIGKKIRYKNKDENDITLFIDAVIMDKTESGYLVSITSDSSNPYSYNKSEIIEVSQVVGFYHNVK